MLLDVKVITNAKKERVICENDKYKVYVGALPEKGRANKRVLEILSGFLGDKPASFVIKKGLISAHKIIEWNKSTTTLSKKKQP
jgi:uncharacterized protein YggU (UPF0235/DUF167 family)